MSSHAGHPRGRIPAGRAVAFAERLAGGTRGRAGSGDGNPRCPGTERGVQDAQRGRAARDSSSSGVSPPALPTGAAPPIPPPRAPRASRPPPPAQRRSRGGRLRTAAPRAAPGCAAEKCIKARGAPHTPPRPPPPCALPSAPHPRKVSGAAGRGAGGGRARRSPRLPGTGRAASRSRRPRFCAHPARPCSAASVPPRGICASRPLCAQGARRGCCAALRGVSAARKGLRGFFSPSRAQKGRAERCRSRRAEVAGLKGRKQLKLLLSD